MGGFIINVFLYRLQLISGVGQAGEKDERVYY